MRGKLMLSLVQKMSVRITPADAGKTILGKSGKATKGDHPRGCGENTGRTTDNGTENGSPPRMRGKLL